jgi:heat shock protein HtpX
VPPDTRRQQLTQVAVLVVLVAAVVGLLVGLAVGLLVGLPLLAVLGLLAGGGAGALLVRRAAAGAEQAALGGLVAREADPVADARLHNLTEGLCATIGLDKPALLVVDSPAANAAALGRDQRATRLLVTRGLVDALERVELEGVLARELRRVKNGQVAVATLAVAAVPLAQRVAPLRHRLAPVLSSVDEVFLDDRGTVDVTRYPPGLAAALARIEAVGSAVAGAPAAGAHLWLVAPAPPPSGAGGTPPLSERIAALREL